MKFDICLMNPPYAGSTHLKFLEKVIEVSDKVVSVQPVNWLLGKKPNKKIFSLINEHYANIEVINGNKYFDAGFFANISINYIDLLQKNNIIYNNEKYNKCEDIKPYSHDKYLTKFANILGDVINSLWDNVNIHASYSKKDTADDNDYCIKLPQIRGHVTSNLNKESIDFYTIISKDDDFIKTQIGLYKDLKKIPNRRGKYEFGYVKFKTQKELIGFVNYIKTDFVRTCLMLIKINSNQFRGELKYIPWFDFSDDIFSKSPKEIDDYLFDKYNISNDIRQHIEEVLPDYYCIR